MKSKIKTILGSILLIVGVTILTYTWWNPTLKHHQYEITQYKRSPANEQAIKEVLSQSQREKDWTDYGDKIVGWISALSGSLVLVCNARKKMQGGSNG